MIFNLRHVKAWFVLLCMASVAACGGGGGGGGGSGGASPPAGRSWGAEQLIETNDLDNAFDPQIAVHANGNALAVWYQLTSGGRSDIWANRYAPATGWGAAELIETNDTGSADQVQIVMDIAGNAVAVWRQHDGARTNIWANRYDAAGGWGTAELIETDDAGNADAARVALDPAGNAIAVWQQHDGTRYNIRANRYDRATGLWESAQTIETGGGDGFQPDVGIDASGDAWVIWSQHDGTEFSVYASRYGFDAASGTGTWDSPALIESGSGDTGYTRIAVHASGTALAVWGQSDGSRYRLWANRYDVVSGWGTAEPIENGIGFIDDPQIEMDANGNGVAIWTQDDNGRDQIWVNRYTSSGWGTELAIGATDGHAGSGKVAFDALGNAIAVWHQSDGTRDNIRARYFSASSSAWGAIQSLENGTGQADSAQIGIDGNGNAVAVWGQSDGNRYNIMANTYQ